MEWVEILCQDEKTGVEYRRLIRRLSIRQVVEYPENDEVLIRFDGSHNQQKERIRYSALKRFLLYLYILHL